MKRLMIFFLLAVPAAHAEEPTKQPTLAVTFEAPALHKFYVFNLGVGMWSAYAEPASFETYLAATSRPTSGALVFLVGGTGTLRLRQATCVGLPAGLEAAPGWINNEFGGNYE